MAALKMRTFSGARAIRSKLLSKPRSCAAVLPVMMVSSMPLHVLVSNSPSRIAHALNDGICVADQRGTRLAERIAILIGPRANADGDEHRQQARQRGAIRAGSLDKFIE